MAKQRNNVMRMPFEARRLVGSMLFDGATYDEVRAALVDRFPAVELDAHNSSLQAYAASDEHQRYVSSREAFERVSTQDAVDAAAVNDGRGVEDMIDLAEMELTRVARQMAGGLEAAGDIAKVASALAAVKRGRSKSKADELAVENARISAQLAGVKAELATAKELIVQLELAVERLAPSKSAKSGDAVADALGRLLGIGAGKSDKSDTSDTSDGAAAHGKSDSSDSSDLSDSSTPGAVNG